MAYAALLSVVQVLEKITHQNHFYNLFTIKQQIKTLHEKFCFLQAFLEDDPPKGEEAIDCLERRIREVAHRAGDVVEFHVLNQTDPGKECLVSRKSKGGSWRKLLSVHRVMSLRNQHGKNIDHSVGTSEKLYQDLQRVVDEVVSVVQEAKMIVESRKIEDLQFGNYTADLGSPRVAPCGKTGMVGFDDDLMELKNQLCGGSSKLQIIPIVGMGGIGKTALATNVFYDSFIVHHFHIRAWTTVTQDHKVLDILLGLLHSITASENLSRGMGELAECLYKSLKGRKYLIVLDDLWSNEAWDEIRMLFPEDHNGSRIILTTRLADVAVYANSSGSFHQMQFLNDEQSWNLLRGKVFGEENYPPELEETGKLIARNCRGLPLSIILVAGLLSRTCRTKYQWEKMARDASEALTASHEQLSSKILSLSYNNLPHHLRACFLYMGGFPEDYEIPVFKLVTMWVAEGFLKPIGSKSLEEVAEEYLGDLVKRNLVLVTKKRSNGNFRFCSIHDLLRDLCLRKARDENFLHLTDGIPEGLENKRRLCFSRHTEWYRLRRFANSKTWPIRSIFYCCDSMMLEGFSLLRVLDILKLILPSFPVETLQLHHLKLLAFTCAFIRGFTLPPLICELQNIETLIVGSSVTLSKSEHRLIAFFPIWKMPQLRHLVFPSIKLCPLPFPAGNYEELPVLENLQTLSSVRNFRLTREAIEMVPNLKKLKVVYTCTSRKRSSEYELNNLVHLHQLQTLNLKFEHSSDWWRDPVPIKFGIPPQLRKLTLIGCLLSWKDMTIIGSLPNLEVLKLRYLSVMDPEWEPVEGEFLRLKFLVMEWLDLKSWVAESTNFPRLECLIIRHCPGLENIPSGIGEIPTLQMIEVDDRMSAAAESASEILDEQRDMGNNVLQVRVGSHWL